MDTELAFPPIEAPAVPRTEVATAAAGALSLDTLNLSKLALAHFGPWRETLAATTATLTGVVHDFSTPTKLADGKSLRHRLINTPLATARATEDGLKKKLNGAKGDVVAEREAIEAGYAEAAKLITPQIEAAEAKIAEEKRQREEAEAARVQKHRDNLVKLAAPIDRARGLPAARIALGIEQVEAIAIDANAWEEFADRAIEQKAVTLERLRDMHGEALAAEAEARRLEEARAEAARVAAEQEAERQRLAAERAEIERQRADLAAQQAATERQRAEAARQEEERRTAEALEHSRQLAAADADRQAAAAEEARQQQEAEARHQLQSPDVDDVANPATNSTMVSAIMDAAPLDIRPVPPLPFVSLVPAAPATEVLTLTLGEIKTRIAPLSIGAEGLEQLGYPATKVKAACMYRESDWPAMRAAMRELLADPDAQQQAA